MPPRHGGSVLGSEMSIPEFDIKSVLDYEPLTGIFYWRERDIGSAGCEEKAKQFNKRYAGSVAGSVDVNKYGFKRVKIFILGRRYLAHHLAWLYMTGEWPKGRIDHINRNGMDNSWSNLRDGSKINDRNKSLSVSNTSGANGVSWDKKKGKWRAQFSSKKGAKRIDKHIGYFSHFDDAKRAAKDFRDSLGFSESHGESIACYRNGES